MATLGAWSTILLCMFWSMMYAWLPWIYTRMHTHAHTTHYLCTWTYTQGLVGQKGVSGHPGNRGFDGIKGKMGEKGPTGPRGEPVSTICNLVPRPSHPSICHLQYQSGGRPGKMCHMQWCTWTCGGVAHSFCTAAKWLSEPKKSHQDRLMLSAQSF